MPLLLPVSNCFPVPRSVSRRKCSYYNTVWVCLQMWASIIGRLKNTALADAEKQVGTGDQRCISAAAARILPRVH